MALFKPGQSGNPAGKPVGTKDRPYLYPAYWHDLLMEQWEHLDPKEKAVIAMKGFSTVMPKVIAAQTPEQSAQNAEAAFKMLKMLQEVGRNGSDAGIGKGSDTPRLEDGRPAAQVIEASTPSL